jgi:hypothetical protein
MARLFVKSWFAELCATRGSGQHSILSAIEKDQVVFLHVGANHSFQPTRYSALRAPTLAAELRR